MFGSGLEREMGGLGLPQSVNLAITTSTEPRHGSCCNFKMSYECAEARSLISWCESYEDLVYTWERKFIIVRRLICLPLNRISVAFGNSHKARNWIRCTKLRCVCDLFVGSVLITMSYLFLSRIWSKSNLESKIVERVSLFYPFNLLPLKFMENILGLQNQLCFFISIIKVTT